MTLNFETKRMEMELTLRFASFLHFLTRMEGAGYFRIALVSFRIQSPEPFLLV